MESILLNCRFENFHFLIKIETIAYIKTIIAKMRDSQLHVFMFSGQSDPDETSDTKETIIKETYKVIMPDVDPLDEDYELTGENE